MKKSCQKTDFRAFEKYENGPHKNSKNKPFKNWSRKEF
jgi:hypothetical protein